jgi:preprotein translocase subunit YajC
MHLFLATSADAAAAGGPSMLIMMVALIGVFYFLMIRPENKRKKEAEAMRNALKVGDNITTIGGVIGDIVSVKEDSIVIETTTDRVRVEFAKFAVSTNNTAEKEAAKKRAAAAEARKAAKAEKKKK